MNLSSIDITKAIENKFNKSKWVKSKFSDLVDNIVEKVIPKESGLEHYIGLEHLDSDSLHINRFGETASLTGDKLKIYEGDIIFAKRNAYLKRVAIAKFDAVASAHSLVLRAKHENVLPEFLPFFLLSETFWERAIEISVGSLSPTINWRVLAKQEFLLPPENQQAEIAELLWALDDLIQNEMVLFTSLSQMKKALLKEAFNRDYCDKVKVSDISENLDNRRIPIKSSDRIKGEFPYYGASGVVDNVDGFIFDEPILLVSEDGENLNSRKLPIAYSVDEKCWVNNHAHVLSVNKASRYLVKEYFNFSDISDFIAGGTRPKITKSMLSDMPIYLPKSDISSAIENRLLIIDNAIFRIEEKIKSSEIFKKALINEVF